MLRVSPFSSPFRALRHVPGVPEPNQSYPAAPLAHRHALPPHARLTSRSVLGGLHHTYAFEREAA